MGRGRWSLGGCRNSDALGDTLDDKEIRGIMQSVYVSEEC